MAFPLENNDGFTLIELVLVIIIIGILAGVATMKMTSSIETSKFEATRSELNQLATAIVGNITPEAKGARTDFGYVGDIGALPPNLDALAVNPGYATWNGPYIHDNNGSDDYKKDAWGVEYIYVNTMLRSLGSGANIDKVFSASSVDLLNNTVFGYLLDADINMPGTQYKDSLEINLMFPDGAGNITMTSINPDANGNFIFTGIPIGNHTLQVIYIPDSDTATYAISVLPGRTSRLEITFMADLW